MGKKMIERATEKDKKSNNLKELKEREPINAYEASSIKYS